MSVDTEALYKKAYDSMIEMDEDAADEVLETAIAEGLDLSELLNKGYSAGMQELGEQFSSGEVFLPDLMFAAEIMQKVSAGIEAELLKTGAAGEKKGKVVMATVHGDVHDIGKGICCSMLKTNGIDVLDLGRDVPADVIVDKAVEFGADIIGMSALLTTTMTVQRDVVNLLTEKGLRDKFKVMVGGAPVTGRWAEKIGADAYTEDATECAKKALEFLVS